MPATCDLCGVTVPHDHPPLTWTSALERGRWKYYCESCSRENLRAIEGKLDSEWW